MTNFTESVVEEAGLDWLHELGYTVVFGPTIAPGEAQTERTTFNEVLLRGRLEAALERLNPGLPPAARVDVKCRPTLYQRSGECVIDVHGLAARRVAVLMGVSGWLP